MTHPDGKDASHPKAPRARRGRAKDAADTSARETSDRWAWRDETSSRSVKRRWQRWRKEVARFQARKRELMAGACAPREDTR